MIRDSWPAVLGSMFVLVHGGAMAQAEADAPPKSSFTIFGTADVQLENVRTSGSTDPATDKPARNRLSNVSSDLGFKGYTTFASGMTAQFQYVTGVNVDNSSGNTSGGMWANAKDVFVGLGVPNVGTLKLGRLTGAARWNAGTADFSPAGAGPQDDQAMISLASGQTASGPLFNVRLDNAVGFESAAWKGLSVRAYYSANEGRSNATVATGAKLSDSSYSLGAQYVIGNLDARVSFERRNDKGTLNNSTTNDTIDKDYRLGIRYTVLPGTQVALGVDHMSFADNTATGTAKTGLHRRGWVLGARHQTGAHVVYGGFGKAGNVACSLANGAACNGEETGARQFVVAYNYVASKELLWEVHLSQVANQTRAKYDFDSGGLSPGVGAKLTSIGAGVRYSF